MDDGVKLGAGLLVESGFAIGVAAFLLIRLEREIKALSKAISDLRTCRVCRFNGEEGAK